MTTQKFISTNFDVWAAAIRERESSNDYGHTNSLGYMGAYQMGIPALKDAGFIDKATGKWTDFAKSLGVDSKESFLASSIAQDIAFEKYTEKNWDYIQPVLGFVGETIGGVYITVSGLLGGLSLSVQVR